MDVHPLSWRTMWMTEPAVTLQSFIFYSSFNCLPENIKRIMGTSTPQLSYNVYLTSRTVASGSTLKLEFTPASVYKAQ